ncbi:hypothetical protein [Paracoccus sp. ME4]|uniref:hypothetical protein n=1 Tax=Paracoccus sp. ME4 TaxID=3138066 RepID=UPI00398AE77B
MDDKAILMIPLWVGYDAEGGEVTLGLKRTPEAALLSADAPPELLGDLEKTGSPEIFVFDTPSEARAVMRAICILHGRSMSCPPEIGLGPNGEGLMMVIHPERARMPAIPLNDLRSRTGYLQDLVGSWEVEAAAATMLVDASPADRVDMAQVVANNIREIANPKLLRAIQNQLERIPGANVGMPAISVEDLLQDVSISERVSTRDVQAALVDHAGRLDPYDRADQVIRLLRDRFGKEIGELALHDGMDI